MAIYNIFDFYEKESRGFIKDGPSINPDAFKTNAIGDEFIPQVDHSKKSFFAALAARFFFFLLLVADVIWGIYSFVMLMVKALFCLVTLCRHQYFLQSLRKTFLSFKRALVCSIALFVALFSPALGIMFSCMYFLMYDKSGVEEIVPTSLRDQFKELFPFSEPS